MTGRPRSYLVSLAIFAAAAAAGAAAMVLTATHVAGVDSVAAQLPYLVSGGLGGLCLVGAGGALVAIQARRLGEARHRTLIVDAVTAATNATAIDER